MNFIISNMEDFEMNRNIIVFYLFNFLIFFLEKNYDICICIICLGTSLLVKY